MKISAISAGSHSILHIRRVPLYDCAPLESAYKETVHQWRVHPVRLCIIGKNLVRPCTIGESTQWNRAILESSPWDCTLMESAHSGTVHHWGVRIARLCTNGERSQWDRAPMESVHSETMHSWGVYAGSEPVHSRRMRKAGNGRCLRVCVDKTVSTQRLLWVHWIS